MSNRPFLRLGTRGSLLARTQAEGFAAALRGAGIDVELVTIATVGDLRTDVTIAGLVAAGRSDGVFVRELEQALFDGRIDAAVHSCKDLPTSLPDGLTLACVPGRAEPFDVLVGRTAGTLATLPAGAVVGTSSIRRVVQVRATRPPRFWPAIAQGALAIEVRTDDGRTRAAVSLLDCPTTHAAVRAERSCLASLAGGCLAPIGGWARQEADGLRLGAAVFAEADGRVSSVTAEAISSPADESPEDLGRRIAAELRLQGADRMLAAARGQPAGD
jgi:hydroxymethylbilane synthase